MKSPLKFKPLSNPGESLHIKLFETALDGIVLGYIFIAISVPLLIFGWSIWYTQKIPHPLLITIPCLPMILFGVYRMVSGARQLKSVRLGLQGEKAVGQFLEKLRANGAIVFHDIVGDKFNLDHVVITKSAIYVIETKTMSKPAKGKTELSYDGATIRWGEKPIMGDPIGQVCAASTWLREILEESTGKRPIIKPVVLFPGWYIRNTHSGKTNVWVLNPKAFPTYIKNEEERIPTEDVHMFASHLCRWIRTQ